MGDCGILAIKLYNPNTQKLIKKSHNSAEWISHRGQDVWGVSFGDKVLRKTGKLPVDLDYKNEIEKFWKKNLKKERDSLILHVRYDTSGKTEDLLKNSQPVKEKHVVTAHNGQVVNIKTCRQKIKKWGLELEGEGDGELITHFLEHYLTLEDNLVKAVSKVQKEIKGGYSVVGKYKDFLFAFKSNNGKKPLSLGISKEGVVFSSETSSTQKAFKNTWIRELNPGELVIEKDKNLSIYQLSYEKENFCMFELLYFAGPSHEFRGKSAALIRKNVGKTLAKRYKKELKKLDYVVSVPESGNYCAQGISEKSQKTLYPAIIRNRDASRTFIENGDTRDDKIHRKYSISGDLENKKIALVDDSVVRGKTIKHLVPYLKEQGVKQIDLFVSFPPVQYPCLDGGIDMADPYQLAVNKHIDKKTGKIDMNALARELGVDNVYYATVEDIRESAGINNYEGCFECNLGNYKLPEAKLTYDKCMQMPKENFKSSRFYEAGVC